MRTEYTRQTRWGHQPEAVDEEVVRPGTLYVKQVAWLPCPECDLQVHTFLTQSIASGASCPECGKRLSSPRVLGTPDVAVSRIQEAEEIMRDALVQESPFTPDETAE
jgi:hypothetical protein